MLVRSAGRRQRRHTARALAASFAQLNLPWLAPAQLRWSASQASAASPAPVPSRSKRKDATQHQHPPAQTRHLATAADQHVARYPGQYPLASYASAYRNSSQDQNVPFEFSPKKPHLSNLRPYDDPIIINTSTQDPTRKIKVLHGVHGSAVDLLQHLHTALQVGRLSRAEAIIQRLGQECPRDSVELVHANTAYLEESLRTVALHGRGEQGKAKLQDMQRWFEVEIRGKDAYVDTKMLVVMIRGAIKALAGSARDRTIRRYLGIAQQMGEDAYNDVLDAEDYDDNEFTILGRVAYIDPDQQVEAPEETEEELEFPAKPTQYQRPDILPLEEVPEVIATDQRGSGLADVKKALHEFIEHPALPSDSNVEDQREQALKRQRIIEETSNDLAVERWRKADEELRKIGINTSMQTRPMGALMWQWYQALVPALEAELKEWTQLAKTASKADTDRHHYGPYLELLPLDKIAATTILHVMTRMIAKDRPGGKYEVEMKLSALTLGLARAVEQECDIKSSTRNPTYRRGSGKSLSRQKQARQSKGKLSGKRAKMEREKAALLASLGWPVEAQVKFGAMLASKLMETAQLPVTRTHPRTKEKITQLQPAFLHRWKYVAGKKLGVLSPNPALVEKAQSEPLGSLIAKRMPMVVEPKPWKGFREGGYLHFPTPILRLTMGDQSGRDYFTAADAKGDMGQIYAGLTALGQVPWKVHHGVFKVQLEAWNSGEEIANFAPLHPQMEYPPEPPKQDNPEPRKKWLADMHDLENKRAGLHSKRCFQNLQLEIARTMVNEVLYFPHNMDFRGRAYPIPPYMNHMGADNVRGLLVFAQGRELGPNGLRWLKIHLATVAGHDKASMSERVQFAENHLDDIYDSVRNPLNGRRWWLESEDAWQTLAACFELTEALDSPDPTKFVSYLPIQQDGTCNGLQHYAALGGDKVGAAQVNLEPSDRPADVYTAVAEAVKTSVHEDALLGNKVAQRLDGHLTRKCVKQPVMTNVYGVTYYGAKEQVQRQLELIFPDVSRHDEIPVNHMAQYIAGKIFKSLGTMFTGAQAIQHWLGQCADRISTCLTPEQVAELTAPESQRRKTKGKIRTKKEIAALEAKRASEHGAGTSESDRKQLSESKPLFKSTVVWTTPLRLPVVQPYRTARLRIVNTNLQGIALSDPRVWHPVSKRKQLQAFPPNFIHSLDATHMLLSALKCKELGITFASIHDSFWTHACDVDRMSVALRDSFVEMHKDNIIGRLKEEFQTRYKGCMYMQSVYVESPVGQQVVAFRKEKKQVASGELALEAERMRLIESEDPEERANGEAMVTPGSILLSANDPSAFDVPSEIKNHQLGTIPANAETEYEATNTDSDETAMTDDHGVVEATEALPEATPQDDAGDTYLTSDARDPKPKPKKGLSKSKQMRKLFVWMPLSFPEVPPKGEFDVHKIRQSNYFFH